MYIDHVGRQKVQYCIYPSATMTLTTCHGYGYMLLGYICCGYYHLF